MIDATELAERLRKLIRSGGSVRINLVVNLLSGAPCLLIEEKGNLPGSRWRKVQPLIFGDDTHASALRFIADALDGNPEVPR